MQIYANIYKYIQTYTNMYKYVQILMSSLDIQSQIPELSFSSLFLVWQWPFGHESALYAYVFPKFLFPFNNIILSCSIYTTVGIAYER